MVGYSAVTLWSMPPTIYRWAQVDPKLSQAPCLKNPRCGYVSKRNTEAGLFDRIVKALKS
jgi:hypothetical protein